MKQIPLVQGVWAGAERAACFQPGLQAWTDRGEPSSHSDSEPWRRQARVESANMFAGVARLLQSSTPTVLVIHAAPRFCVRAIFRTPACNL
jgi:hypothetical protein